MAKLAAPQDAHAVHHTVGSTVSPTPGPSFEGTPSGGSHAASVEYLERRAWIGEYFDRTAAAGWKALTSTDKVSRIRATVRAGRDQMRLTLLSWLPQDLRGWRILDAGCGTGMLAVDLAQRGAEVVAIDLSPTLVGYGRDRALEAGVADRITFRDGDMLDPSVGTFDAMVAMDSLIHYDLPQITGSLESMAARCRGPILYTVAPWTPFLGTLHSLGRLFPQRDRAPRIIVTSERRLRKAVLAAPGLTGWTFGRTQRVEKGFYRSQAYEVRPVSTGAASTTAGSPLSGAAQS